MKAILFLPMKDHFLLGTVKNVIDGRKKKKLLGKLKMHTSDCLILTVAIMVFSHVNWALMLSVSAKFIAMLLASLLEVG